MESIGSESVKEENRECERERKKKFGWRQKQNEFHARHLKLMKLHKRPIERRQFAGQTVNLTKMKIDLTLSGTQRGQTVKQNEETNQMLVEKKQLSLKKLIFFYFQNKKKNCSCRKS